MTVLAVFWQPNPSPVVALRDLPSLSHDSAMQVSDGGGLADEGEEIQVLELPLSEALAMVTDGRICDAKTIMLLQYVALHRLIPH